MFLAASFPPPSSCHSLTLHCCPALLPLQAERLWYLLCVALLNPFAANVDFLAFCLLVVRFVFLLLLPLPPLFPSLSLVIRLDRNVGNFICGFV